MKADLPPAALRSEDLIDLPELARTLGRYKWGIAGLTLVISALTALVAFTVTPTYRSTVSILIELKPQQIVQIRDVYDPGTGLNEYYGTQYMVLKSRDLAEKVVDKLKLTEHQEFAEISGDSPAARLDLRRYLPFLPEPPVRSVDEAERRASVIDQVMENLTVEPVALTQIIKVSYEAHDAKLAAAVPNALAELYIESGLQAKLDATQKATQWLTAKLTDIQAQLAKSEAALQAFREQEQLVNVGGTRALSEEELVDYSRRLREAQKKRADLEASYEKVRAAGSNPQRLRDVSNLLLDPIVQRANESFLSAQEAVKQLEERYGSKHPQMATARARLATAEAALNEQLRIAAQGVKTEYEIARESERQLQGQVSGARSQIQRLDRKDYELSSLQREVTANRELYDTFLTRFKEADTTSNFETLIARVIDPAIVPQIPYAPQKKKWVLIAAAIGLVLSLMLALVHYLLSEGVRSAEELEALAELPVIGVLPLVMSIIGRKQNLPKFFLEKPRTPFAEGVRSIRAALRLNDTDQRLQRIMVTSSVPAEGKSSVSAALAMAMGTGERVVLVETDLRRPTLRQRLGIKNPVPGITEYLAGKASLEDCLQELPPAGITLLAAGQQPDNPSELLSSEAFAHLLAQLGQRYDRVVLDSPPCQAAADALVVCRLAQAVLFVVKSEATTRRSIKSSLKQLRYVGAPLVGLVINQVDTRRNSAYAQGYHYAYDYYG